MTCIHNRPLRSPCIDCDPLSFFVEKLTEALDKGDEELRRDVLCWRNRGKRSIKDRGE